MSFVKVTSPRGGGRLRADAGRATTPRTPATDPHSQSENFGDARRVADRTCSRVDGGLTARGELPQEAADTATAEGV